MGDFNTILHVEDLQHKLYLIAPVTNDEVFQALKGINDLKAPGYDGYNALLFKRAWPVVGEDITKAVLKFFSLGCMHEPVNCTTITLIPKVKNPTRVSEFRPISCCIILYKLISKILTQTTTSYGYVS